MKQLQLLFVDVLNDTNINLAFVIYEESILCPVHSETDATNSTSVTAVGSAVVGMNVSGIATGTQLNDNVTISLTLRNPNTDSIEASTQILCVIEII